MRTTAFHDKYPGNIKILFIGLSQSTHTHAWIDLLSKSEFNVRVFSPAGGPPPDGWHVMTYLSGLTQGSDTGERCYLYSGWQSQSILFIDKITSKLIRKPVSRSEEWLAEIIREWQPDIVHTLGIFDDQGGLFYFHARRKFKLQGFGKWVVHIRGGSDITLRRHSRKFATLIRQILGEADQIVSDNIINIQYAEELGISAEKFAAIVPIPGTGGVNVRELSQGLTPPSKRERIVLWPKAYEHRLWSKALPVLDALLIAWDKIAPCDIYMLAVTPGIYKNYLRLPAKIREHCKIHDRIPRIEVLALMKRARVLLIPSLIDGIPNSLYEAMACGTMPIVSPLETIQSVVKNEKNVLFARNLYANEIAEALIKAMNNDWLVDEVARSNLVLVRQIADRELLAPKVIDFYTSMVGRS